MSVTASGAWPRKRASASTSLKPVWCGLILSVPHAGTSRVAQHPQRARSKAEVDAIEHQDAARRSDGVEKIDALRAAIEQSHRFGKLVMPRAAPRPRARRSPRRPKGRCLCPAPAPDSGTSSSPVPSLRNRCRLRARAPPVLRYIKSYVEARPLAPERRAGRGRRGPGRSRVLPAETLRGAACMSHATCRCIQNVASLPKNRASRTAVSGVMRPPAADEFVDPPSGHAQRRSELGLADRERLQEPRCEELPRVRRACATPGQARGPLAPAAGPVAARAHCARPPASCRAAACRDSRLAAPA